MPCPLLRADWIKLMISAVCLPLRYDPAKGRFVQLLNVAQGLIGEHAL
jgi:hypothetical protein